MIDQQNQYKTSIIFVIDLKMFYNSNIPSQEPDIGSEHVLYRGLSSNKGVYLHSQSEKNIRNKQSTELSSDSQSNQEPFYFKLYNSNKKLPTSRIESKPELINLQNMKKVLNYNYSEDLLKKSQRLRAEQKRKIMEEQDYLSSFEKHKQLENRRLHRLKSEYNKNLYEQINKRRAVIQINKTKQRQYDQSFKTRQNNLANKAQAWRNFYEQAYIYRDSVETDYNEYMKQQKKHEQKRNKIKLLNLYSDHKDYSQQRQFERNIKQQQTIALKNMLEKQINEKAQKCKELPKNSGNIQNQVYHPILNPIDYKIDVKNRYLLQQIAPKNFFI